ncbi:DUF7537 family lipoprotein [Halorarius litoreus]|uniref:DUF7537 family lipoprotein n=1 Tax=Halorarius litoreus TaxID=2962676 RepID=UPI0020CD1E76|nr:hypothetical protein [Halorarius litoreus]
MSRRALLVVALLVGLAGCSGTPVTEDTATPTAVATPAPVPTESLPENRIAPGVSPQRIVDAERLAAAHKSALTDRSYTRTSGTTYRFANGTLLARTTFTRSVDRAADRQLLVRGRTGAPFRTYQYAEWANGTLVLERIVRNETVRYERRARSELTIAEPGGGVAAFLAEQDPRVAGKRTVNGTVEYVLVARNVTRVPVLEHIGANRTTPIRLVAAVTPEGLVRSIRLSAEGTYRGEPVRAVNRYRIRSVGETHVGRPPWLDAALNATREPPTGNATATTAG